jgi:hypothetical protein
MIWPILARYAIAMTAGATWNVCSPSAKVLRVVILVALVGSDTADALRHERHDARAGQRVQPVGESSGEVLVHGVLSTTLALRTRAVRVLALLKIEGQARSRATPVSANSEDLLSR